MIVLCTCITVDSDSGSSEDSLPPLPKSRGATVKSTQSRRKLRSCTLMIVTHMCTGAQSCESVHIALGSNPHPQEVSEPPAASLPRSEGAGAGILLATMLRTLRPRWVGI